MGRIRVGMIAGAIISISAACGTSSQIIDLGDKLGCADVEETGKIDMGGSGLAAFCEGLPEADTALILWFNSQDARNDFFAETWENTEFTGSFVLVGGDWAIAIDTTGPIVEKAAALQDRVGGVPLSELSED